MNEPRKERAPDFGRGVIQTEVSRLLAAVLVGFFLLVVVAVPLGQLALDERRGEPPFVLELFKHRLTREWIQQFEADLEKNSDVKDYVQPRVQGLLTRFGRVGNKKAVVGRAGFLYYVPGIEYVAGPGFLEPAVLELRERTAREADLPIHANPLPAILEFQRFLSARGITLVVFPVPDKAMLEPFTLHGRGDPHLRRPVAGNVDFARFAGELRQKKVALFDPTPDALEPGAARRYLIQDTHWTPAFMQAVAARLARFVEREGRLQAPAVPPRYTRTPAAVERIGDVADMLKLLDDQTLFLPERVSIDVVKDAEGADYESDADGDVLLLGDSFTNVFTQDFMGWGSAAGLGPQLAFALGRGVDVVAQNDAGAFATRRALARELEQNPERLAKKRVVIWEFAVRELAVGDWKPVVWPAAAKGAQP